MDGEQQCGSNRLLGFEIGKEDGGDGYSLWVVRRTLVKFLSSKFVHIIPGPADGGNGCDGMFPLGYMVLKSARRTILMDNPLSRTSYSSQILVFLVCPDNFRVCQRWEYIEGYSVLPTEYSIWNQQREWCWWVLPWVIRRTVVKIWSWELVQIISGCADGSNG